MGLLKHPLNNERGSVLLMGLGMIVLATSMIVAVTLMSGKESSQRKYDRDRAAINDINNNVQTLLADARFCNDFFRQGYAGTTNTTIPFKESSLKSSATSAYANRSKEIMKEYAEKFSRYGYEVESVSLSAMAIQTGVGQGNDNVKTFDVSVSVKKKSSSPSGGILNQVIFGKDGYNKSNLIEHVSLAMTEKTGSCTLYKKALSSMTSVAGMKALEDSCLSLGGTVDKNTFTCQLPKFENLNAHTATEIADGFTDGILNYSQKTANTKFNFADALCEMEKNVLRKNRQNVSASYATNRTKNWTNFCKKPQWGGCFENNQYYFQGESYVRQHSMKAKSIKDFIKTRQNKTTERRFSRLYASPAQGSIADSLSISKINGLEDEQTHLSKYFGGGIAKALGLSGGFGITVAGISMTDLAIAAFSFGAIGVVITLLLGGCDKGRVYVTRVCADGKFEDTLFRYQTQKRKRFRCKWKSLNTVNTADDVTIATKIKGQIGSGGSNGLGNPIELPKFIASESGSTVLTPEEIALRKAENEAAIKEINAAKTLADLIEEYDSDEVGDAGLPEGGLDEVQLAYKAKEAALLNAHQAKISDVQARLAALTADPTVPIDPIVLSNLKKEAASLTSELLSYQNYQKTLAGVDKAKVSNQLASLSSISSTLKTL